MTVFQGPRNALAGLLAAMCPPRLAYHIARRVVAHATLDRYADTAPRSLRALDALNHWHDTKVDRPKVDPFEAVDRMPGLANSSADLRDAGPYRPPLPVFEPVGRVDEDDDQLELVEQALGRR